MSLKVGIVGLPNVGKSTLFNALLRKQQALVADFPFTTIKPNVGVVPVPDDRLNILARIVGENRDWQRPYRKVPATVEFVDIAGLIAGAHRGEGLGNKFLSHIREVDAVCHVLRLFSSSKAEGRERVDPKEDFETVETELKLADLQTLEKQKEPKGVVDKEVRQRWEAVVKLKTLLQKGEAVRDGALSGDEIQTAKDLNLLTVKPILTVLNISEQDLDRGSTLEENSSRKMDISKDQTVAISAKLESQLAELTEEEGREYLSGLGVDRSGLERLVQKAFSTLGLITFLTTGESEVRAWTIKDGTTAQKAAGVVHTDFERNFIKAHVVGFEDFVDLRGWESARGAGKVRVEGRGYIVRDGDVVKFLAG